MNYKFHIVYKVKNKINNKIYIGVHSTDNIEDDYYGSGNNIKNAILKYGISNFTKQILYICKTRKEAFLIEENIVNENFVASEKTYNMALGGGSSGMWGKKQPESQKIKVSMALKGKKRSKKSIENQRESLLKTIHAEGYVNKNKGKRTSLEIRQKISKNHHDVSGSNNPMWNKKHSNYTKQKLRVAAKNRSRLICDHCGKESDVSNYARWHGDNCKNRKTRN